MSVFPTADNPSFSQDITMCEVAQQIIGHDGYLRSCYAYGGTITSETVHAKEKSRCRRCREERRRGWVMV